VANPVAKKKKKKVDPRIVEQIDEYKERSAIRLKIAKAAYDAQDQKTRQVIESIQNQLLVGASGVIRVFPTGKRNESIAVKVDMEYVENNTLYVATEILKDLALMDVKVANYKFPTVFCAECGDKIPKKKPKSKGKK
jgi:hypothetical protein